METRPRTQKLPPMTAAELAVNFSFFSVKSLTELNKMIDTASLTIPSPKTRLNSLGYFFGLMSDTAAITSDEQSREHISKISVVLRFTGESTQTP